MDAELNRRALMEPTPSQPLLDVYPNYPELNLGEPKPVLTETPRGIQCSTILSSSSSSASSSTPLPFHGGPIITKKTRSPSTTERSKGNPIERGTISYFSRAKGHGFVVNEARGPGEHIFVHISDIEGELVPRQGDEVAYKLCPIPPKLEKYQAIHVRILNFTPDVHLRWDTPLGEDEKKDPTPDPYVT